MVPLAARGVISADPPSPQLTMYCKVWHHTVLGSLLAANLLTLIRQRITVHAGDVSALVFAQAFIDQPQSLPNSPSTMGQLAAGLAGLLAVPVVVWSEYTLKTTGKQL